MALTEWILLKYILLFEYICSGCVGQCCVMYGCLNVSSVCMWVCVCARICDVHVFVCVYVVLSLGT